jgi:hypothetical protein
VQNQFILAKLFFTCFYTNVFSKCGENKMHNIYLNYSSFSRSKINMSKNNDKSFGNNQKRKEDHVSFTSKSSSIKLGQGDLDWLQSGPTALRENPSNAIKRLLKVQQTVSEFVTALEQFPKGVLKVDGRKVRATSFDCDDGLNPNSTITEFMISPGVNVFHPGTSADEILNQSFPKRPFATIGPVGWSNVKPNLIDPKKLNMNYFGKGDKAQRQALQIAYENGFNKFMGPILAYLKGAGLKMDRTAYVCSPSYCGIDKAVMDFAEKERHQLITVGPYRFAEYISKEHEHRFPIVFENSLVDYGAKFSQLADVTLVSGGRKHPWLFDTTNKFIGDRGATIPVDLFKLFYDVEIPAQSDDKIENAARMLQELGVNPFGRETQELFNSMPNEGKELLQFDEQRALATKIHELYKAREKAAALTE